jgi:hypothetical protein
MSENNDGEVEEPLSVSERRELEVLRREKREWVVERNCSAGG